MHTANQVLRGLTPEQVRRFWTKVEQRDPAECWPWLGAIHWRGYGTWTVSLPGGGSTSLRPHRLAYWLAVAEIPDGQVIDHLCGNKTCVNPNHLEAVSAARNGSRSPMDVLSALNAEAEIASVIRTHGLDHNAAAAAVVRFISEHPEMLGLMRDLRARVA